MKKLAGQNAHEQHTPRSTVQKLRGKVTMGTAATSIQQNKNETYTSNFGGNDDKRYAKKMFSQLHRDRTRGPRIQSLTNELKLTSTGS